MSLNPILGVNIRSHLSLLEPAVIRNCTTAMLTRQVSASFLLSARRPSPINHYTVKLVILIVVWLPATAREVSYSFGRL
jgi:hypothetical protein